MLVIRLGISVNQWNIIKFVLIEAFVSIVFSSAWNLYVQRSAARKLRDDKPVRVIQSDFGRLTPAEVSIRCVDDTGGPKRLENWPAHAWLLAVNVLLFAMLFMLEIGSTDKPRIKWREVSVVTTQSIAAHSRRVAERASETVTLPISAVRGFQASTRRALRVLQNAPGNYSRYELREHVLDAPSRLDRAGVAATIDEVCGDSAILDIPLCTRVLAPFFAPSDTQGRRVFARVTKRHKLGGIESNMRMYDVTILYSLNATKGDLIELRANQITGTCHGEPYPADTFVRKREEVTIGSKSCVLREARSGRVFVLFPVMQTSFKLGQHRNEVNVTRRLGGEGAWVPINGTIFMEIAPNCVLSFIPSVDIDTYTAALALVPQGSAYRDMAKTGSLSLAVFREYRQHVLLLCLGLFGEYFERRRSPIALETQQAAINTLFVVGLAGLLLFTLTLVLFSLSMEKASPLIVPVEMSNLLERIRKAACQDVPKADRWPRLKQIRKKGQQRLFACEHTDMCTYIEQCGSQCRSVRQQTATAPWLDFRFSTGGSMQENVELEREVANA